MKSSAKKVELASVDDLFSTTVEDEETLEVTETPDTTKAQLQEAVDNYLDTDYMR